MLRLLLVRHAQSIANQKGITQGQKVDEPLSELGKKQAQKLAQGLKNEAIESIYSSDLKRAMHTTEEIQKLVNKKCIVDKRLREKDHDTEKNEDLTIRCKSFLEDIKQLSGTVLVVAHGGSTRAILGISTGDRKKGADLVKDMKQYNACINELHFQENNWLIRKINDVDFLEPFERSS
ncbi:MAG: histidine phosphatase family protein [bacterium]|nr:histidine phosphatase family protein [bacterium]